MCSQTETNKTERIFLEALCFCLLCWTSVNCWKFVETNFDIDRSWAEEVNGQNLCDYKNYRLKHRYYVCDEATKGQNEKGKITIPPISLKKYSKLKEDEVECFETPLTVYFSVRRQDGSHVTAERYLFTCPTNDEEGKKYYFGRGKNLNEIGVYKIQLVEKKKKLCFIGYVKGIDLVYFYYRWISVWNKIPLLNFLAPSGKTPS